MFDLKESRVFKTLTVAREMELAFDRTLKAFGVSKVQWMALYFINAKRNISQKELAKEMCVTEPTVAGLVVRMENLKMIKRAIDKDDKRKRVLLITDQGQEVYDRACQVAEELHAYYHQNLSEEECRNFDQVLEKFYAKALAK